MNRITNNKIYSKLTYMALKGKVSNIKQQYDSWVVYAVKLGGVCGLSILKLRVIFIVW